MASRSPSRGRSVSRSPIRRDSRSPQRSRSPLRSHSPPPRANGHGIRRSSSRDPIDSRARGHSYSRSPPRRSPTRRSAKVVIEKLTKNVNEDHLRELFGAYGRVREVDLPINKQCTSAYDWPCNEAILKQCSLHQSRHSVHSIRRNGRGRDGYCPYARSTN